MIKSSVTISLVPQAAGGPFVFSGDLAESCRHAAAIGFDAVEIFAPSADAVDKKVLKDVLTGNNLKLAALGTGAGFVLKKLCLCDPDSWRRRQAIDFIAGFIELAGSFEVPAIVGSMQGSVPKGTDRAAAEQWLREGLNELALLSERNGVPLLLEPLNRYETNLINRLEQGVELIKSLHSSHVKLLADLFHINIEEDSISGAIRRSGRYVGYAHLVDSNRRPAGCGHINFEEVAKTLREIGYAGYVSAEALPYPNSVAAAGQTMRIFRRYFAEG